jgi:tRNA-splicing ligase RtcB
MYTKASNYWHVMFRRAVSTTAAATVSARGCATAAGAGPEMLQPPVGHAVRAWTRGVPVEAEAVKQLHRLASMRDIVQHPIAAMPDLHVGHGITVGTVIPQTKAIIPAAVGVDIGCGMLAAKTSLTAADLPPNLDAVRFAIEVAVPHGRTHNGQAQNDAGGWRGNVPQHVADVWRTQLAAEFAVIACKRPELERTNNVNHLGTLGTGNHFIEVCLDEADAVWLMLHSGSRGVGNKIGATFIEAAKRDMGALLPTIPSAELAYLREGTRHFDDYVEALMWAQRFARLSREVMMHLALGALRTVPGLPAFTVSAAAVNCHHNYVEHVAVPAAVAAAGAEETMVWLTRKGATSAKAGELGIIPGSMGARSFIVRGKGNAASYNSCSHGAGRQFSRGEAKRRFTVEQHIAATAGVACRVDRDVLDETPMAYKDIDAVMAAQSDLVDIVHALRQVVCVKG